ncbi:MAG: DUF177 domain-containing protein [Armatimonadetes bacterium]|nr:DUF177 domain-containing protein [Armatimonadota bacterium]
MKRDDILDLHDVLQHPGRTIAVDISTDLPEEEDLDLVTPLEGFLEAMSTGSMLLVTGEFKTRCTLECSRCGGPIEQDVEFEISEEFPVEGTPASYGTDDHARVKADEEPYPLFEENNLLVENLLRQDFWINMPMQPICEHGWEGPCPQAAEIDAMRSRGHLDHPFDLLGKLKTEGPEE